jgi:hypothetical protein
VETAAAPTPPRLPALASEPTLPAAVYTEEQKHSNDLSQPIVALAVDDMRSATRAKGVDFYK